jgi:hypothetical protein
MRSRYDEVIEHRPGINDDDLRAKIEGFVGYKPA